MRIKKNYVVSGIIFCEKKILLIYHGKYNKWIYPGGHIKSFENPEEALKREIWEEVGINIKIINNTKYLHLNTIQTSLIKVPFAIVEETIVENEIENILNIDLIYLCEYTNKKDVVIDNREALDFGWFGIDEALNLDGFSELQPLIKEAYRIYSKYLKEI